MKKFWMLACLFSLLPISALAATAKTKDLSLTQSVEISGKQLKPGDYRLKWDDNGTADTTSVIFYQGNKVVATAPAKIVREKSGDHVDFEVNTEGGTNKLDRVYQHDEILTFGDSGSTTGN